MTRLLHLRLVCIPLVSILMACLVLYVVRLHESIKSMEGAHAKLMQQNMLMTIANANLSFHRWLDKTGASGLRNASEEQWTEYTRSHMVLFLPMQRSNGKKAVEACKAAGRSICSQEHLVVARLRGGWEQCERGWIRNPEFKPVYRKVQQERINLQRGGSKTGMSGKHQWYVAVASEIGAKCPQTDFQYLKRNAPDWDTSGPQVLYLSPFDNNHVAQEGVGTYCCLDLPKGYNQECMRGDMSPAVMYSSQYAASKVLQRYGMLMTPAMGTLLQMYRDGKVQCYEKDSDWHLVYADPALGLNFDVPHWSVKGELLDSKVTRELRELGISQHKMLLGHWATLMGNDYYGLQELYPTYYRPINNVTFTCGAPKQDAKCTFPRADLAPSTFDKVYCCGTTWNVTRKEVTESILKQTYGASWKVPNQNGCHAMNC